MVFVGGWFICYFTMLILTLSARSAISADFSMEIYKKAAELGIKELNTVTVGNEDVREQNGITIEAVPFWQWALSL